MPVKAKPGRLPDSREGTTAILRLDLLRAYKPEWFLGDFTAGLVIFATTIPAALAYGQLAGLHPINGLYASLLALAVYAFFGTSRQLIINPEAAVAILVATSVASVYSGGDPVRFATLAALQAVMIGVMQVCAGVGRLGFVSDFIPKSVVNGFINGIALIIILAQAGRFSGIELKNEAFFPRIWELVARAHEAHQLTLYVGGACLLGMLIMRPLLRWIPEAVVMVVLATRGRVAVGPGGPGSPTGRVGSGGFAASGDSPCGVRRYSDHAARGRGGGPGFLCGYHHYGAGLCPARRIPPGPQSRVDRPGPGQHGHRFLPGFRHRVQPLAHRH